MEDDNGFTSYRYNSNGNLEKEIRFWKSGRINYMTEFNYMERGKLIREYKYQDQYQIYHINFEYYENLLLKRQYQSKDGKPNGYQFDYDENGNLTRKTFFEEYVDEAIMKKLYLYYPNGNLQMYEEMNDYQELIKKNTYYTNGQLDEEKTFDYNSEGLARSYYKKYNVKGRLLCERFFYGKQLVREKIYEEERKEKIYPKIK